MDGDNSFTWTQWISSICGMLLILAALVSAAWPEYLSFTWPTVALLSGGVLVLFFPDILANIEGIKWGDKEVKFLVAKLHKDVENVEEGTNLQKPDKLLNLTDNAKKDEPDKTKSLPDNAKKDETVNKGTWGEVAQILGGREPSSFDIESKVLDLAAKDKESALVRLAIEIERQLLFLHEMYHLPAQQHPTWSRLLADLTNNKVITEDFANTILEFRNVRNRVIHSGFQGQLQEGLVTRAMDSGLKLFRLLRSITLEKREL